MSYIPTEKELDEIIDFIRNDINRELEWQDLWDKKQPSEDELSARKALEKIGITKGAGNYLVALGLLCYTEAFGKFMRRKLKKPEVSRTSFNDFLELMGDEYRELVISEKRPYDLRCDFAHEYSPKNMSVTMRGDRTPYRDRDGWHFSVKRYYDDLIKTVEENKERLYQ